eukprot:gene12125-14186_t
MYPKAKIFGFKDSLVNKNTTTTVDTTTSTATPAKPVKRVQLNASRDSSEDSEDDDESEEDDDDDDDDSEDDSFDLSDIEIRKDDTYEVKNLKIKLLKEKSKVMDAKETIGSLVEQITAYKASVEDEKQELEAKLKHEKKTKLEIFEIYRDLESERDNLGKQLDMVIVECEQLEKEKQAMSKDNINNLQTLMNEITTIEENNLALEKELTVERENNKALATRLSEQMAINQRLDALASEINAVSGNGGSDSGAMAAMRKQLVDTQAALAKEREKMSNLDSLMFQARRIIGIEGNASAAEHSGIEINNLRTNVMDEKNSHHKTQLLLEEEKRKSELNKKTADNLVARIKELISSHHETLQQLDDEKENSKLLEVETDKLREQLNSIMLNQQNNNQQRPTTNNNSNVNNNTNEISSESSTPGITGSPSSEPVGYLTSDSANSTPPIGTTSPAIPVTSSDQSQSNNNKEDPFIGKSINNQRMYKTIRRNQTIKYINDIGGDLSLFEKPLVAGGATTQHSSSVNSSLESQKKEVDLETKSQKGSVNFGGRFNFTTSSSGGALSGTTSTSPALERSNSKSLGGGSISAAKVKRDKKLEKEIKEITKKIEKEERKKQQNGTKKKDAKEAKESSKSTSSSLKESQEKETPPPLSAMKSERFDSSSLKDLPDYLKGQELLTDAQAKAMAGSQSGKDTATKRKSIWFLNK